MDIQDEKHILFSCMGTGHLHYQFNQYFVNIPNGDIKVLFFNITKMFTNS